VTLELSIHSPGDYNHFQHYGFDADPDPESVGDTMQPIHDPAHGYEEGTRRGAGLEQIRRLWGFNPIDINSYWPLGWIDFITGLVIRRQTRRHLTPQGLSRILKALPNLDTLAVEFWRGWTEWEQNLTDTGQYLLHRELVVLDMR
jgi:hypothetical protein